jgi:hypothetical protein
VLSYEAVRTEADPAQTLLDFFNAAYLAGAQSAG